MKGMRYKFIFLVALSMTALTACDHELEVEETSANLTDDHLIHVSVEEGITRSGYTSSNLSEFGFFVNTPESPDYTYNNVRMTKGEDGEWNPENGLVMQWKDKTTPVDIVAYAPYNEEDTLTTYSQIPISIKADQRSEENLIASDFIAMKWKDFFPERDEKAGKVPLQLKHLMCRLKITIIYDAILKDEEGNSIIENVEVFGSIIRMKAVCDFSEAEPVITTPTESDNTRIYPFQTADIPEECKATYECIIIPQIGDLNIEIYFHGLNTSSYRTTSSESFKGGYSYNLEIRVKDSESSHFK